MVAVEGIHIHTSTVQSLQWSWRRLLSCSLRWKRHNVESVTYFAVWRYVSAL